MDKRKASPIGFFAVGIALMVVGLSNDTNAILFVGIVFIIIGFAVKRRKSADKPKDD